MYGEHVFCSSISGSRDPLFDQDEKMKKIDDIREYVENLKKVSPLRYAEKIGCVMARIGVEGEKIFTYVSDGTLETVNRVKRDENGNLDIVATMADPSGKKIIDEYGRTNTIIVPRKTFERNYLCALQPLQTQIEQVYKPKGEVRQFIRIDEDISFKASWGEAQNLKAGSFLNITDSEDIYGIAYEEFMHTYLFVDDKDIPC